MLSHHHKFNDVSEHAVERLHKYVRHVVFRMTPPDPFFPFPTLAPSNTFTQRVSQARRNIHLVRSIYLGTGSWV